VDIDEFGTKPVHGKHCSSCEQFASFAAGPRQFELAGPGCGGSFTQEEEPCAKFLVELEPDDDSVNVVRVTPMKPFGPKQPWVFTTDELRAPRLRALMGTHADVLAVLSYN
jgi:hypothetical protein